MPDVISKVSFRSPGAAPPAEAGAYPIYPGLIRFTVPTVRAKYSVQYRTGTLTVAAAGPIAFTQKGETDVSPPSGGFVWTLPFTPVVGRTIVLLVGATGASQAPPGFSVPTTGGDIAYARVGGSGYKAEIADGYVLAAFTRKVEGGDGSETVKITYADPGGGFPGSQLVALEYENVADPAVTAFVKAEVPLASAVRPNPLPPLDLDGTTGQAVIFAFNGTVGLPGSGGVGPTVPGGYTGRYSMAGTDICTGQDINCGDRVGASGVGPTTVSVTWTPGATDRGYVGLGFALTKG